jgi:hypothetical protein
LQRIKQVAFDISANRKSMKCGGVLEPGEILLSQCGLNRLEFEPSTATMKVLVRFPQPVYQGLLGRCSMLSREYLILKNGIVMRDHEEQAGEPTVEILCEVERAKFLLNLATLVYPKAAPHIEKSIELAGEE